MYSFHRTLSYLDSSREKHCGWVSREIPHSHVGDFWASRSGGISKTQLRFYSGAHLAHSSHTSEWIESKDDLLQILGVNLFFLGTPQAWGRTWFRCFIPDICKGTITTHFWHSTSQLSLHSSWRHLGRSETFIRSFNANCDRSVYSLQRRS